MKFQNVLPFRELKYKTLEEFQQAPPHEIKQIKQYRAKTTCDEYTPYF
jgi:hypothetical protein